MQALVDKTAEACQALAEAIQADTDTSSMADFRDNLSSITHLQLLETLGETLTDLFCAHANEVVHAGLEVWAYSSEEDPLQWCEEVLTFTLRLILAESSFAHSTRPSEGKLDSAEFQLLVSSFWAALNQDPSTSTNASHATLLRCLDKAVRDCKDLIDEYHEDISKVPNTSRVATAIKSGLASVCQLIRGKLPDSARMVSDFQLTQLSLSEDLGLSELAKEAFSSACLLAMSVTLGREATIEDLRTGMLINRNTGDGVAVENVLDIEVYSRAFGVPHT